jgi:hypothetical protein
MSRAPYKLPNVFVGCPYGGKFKFNAFKATLERLPFKFFYADTKIRTRQLLGILQGYISAADFCLFDVSTWNPNVALEVGLAEAAGAEYYILLHRNLSSGVPADIQGIQRIEYSSYRDFDEQQGLLPLLVKYLVKDQTHPRNIWNELPAENRSRKYYLALRILAHFRDHSRLSVDDLRRISKGTYLRRGTQDEVLDLLATLGLVSSVGSRKGAALRKNLFKDDIRVR